MKLLFDQNLSFRLVSLVGEAYPGCAHVREFGLEAVSDSRIWQYAREHGLTIVTKDSGFRQRSFLLGHPPKVIWLRLGNCSTDRVAGLLWSRRAEVVRFCQNSDAAFLALG